MAAETALTYRLQGIPSAYDRDDVQVLVSRLLSVDKSKVSVRSLAQHPLKDDSKTATLSLLEKPAAIATKQQIGAWSFREPDQNVAGGFIDITLDTHFHGFTPLHRLEDEQCNVDLIALSGLNGHAFGSFKAKGLDFMWIRDSLPTHFPNCRIFIYGYDTSMIQSASHQSILDLGSQLASSLRGLSSGTGNAFKSDRSLILLGHSLGGLVVEQAIVDLSSRLGSLSTGNERILQSIQGVLLFGVPQKGMSVEALKTMVKEQPNEDLVTSLRVDSAFLQLQQENFREARPKMKNATIVAFFETQATPTVQNVSGKWEMTGPSKLLVAKMSATPKSDISVAINRNHSEIVKFQPNDADYDRVLSELHRVRKRSHEQQSNVEVHSPTEEETEALQSIGFSEQHWRRDEICPGEDTCEWLTNNTNFQNWLSNPEDPERRRLWIRGHPGSGKSTLMKHTWEYLNRRLPALVALVSFFFHARGVSLQQTRMGFFRSVLHQLAFRLPQVRSNFMLRYEEKRTATKDVQWAEYELQELIRDALASCTKPVCILVDALDESGKQTAVDLVKWFGRLTNFPTVRIIFSCRYYPILPTISKFAISMEVENPGDIERIVRAELRSEFNENEAQILENAIIQKANGMFQWAALVTNSVVETYRETGQSLDALRDMIGRLPPDLHALYDSLLSTLQGSEKNQAIKLLNWILFAVKPLNLHQLQHALAIDTNMAARSVSEFTKSPLFVDVERAVKTLSRGLVEVKAHEYSETAQFIHQSVLDYLKADGLANLIGVGKRIEAFGYAHFQLSRSCIRYLMMEDLVNAINDLDDDPDTARERLGEEFPLAGYARCYWILHTVIAEIYEHDQQDLLEILPWIREDKIPLHFTIDQDLDLFLCNNKYCLDIVRERLESDALPAKKKDGLPDILDLSYDLNLVKKDAWDEYFQLKDQIPFNLFALTGIRCVWKQLLAEVEEDDRTLHRGGVSQILFWTLEVGCCDPALEHRSPPRVRDLNEPSPLLCLLLGNPDIKLEELPGMLIEACVNDRFHVTPLFCAVAMKRRDLVGAFINAGASIDPSCDDYPDNYLSAYEVAILVEDVGIIRQMIDAYGKGPPTDHAESALHFAINWEYDDAITMLIEHCSNRYTAEEFINFWSDRHKETPLLAALRTRNLKVCQKLIGAGADVETSGDGLSPLLHCVREGFSEGVSLLLENGADPNCGPPGSPTPLMETMSRLDKDTIELLLGERRTDPNRADSKGLTAIMRMLLEAYEKGHDQAGVVEVVKFCVSTGRFDLELKDERGETLLSKAVTTMHPEVVDILLADEQADPNTRGTCGWTPLMKSAFMGYRTTTQLLLSCADIEIEAQDCWGKTALYYAVIKSKMACANLVLRHPKADLLSSKAMLSSGCFEAAKQGEEDFLVHLPDLRPSWLGQFLVSEIYTRARNENQGRIIRRLEEAGFVPQEDVVMTGAP